MFITNFILKLLFNFVPFENNEYETLKEDVNSEWTSILCNPKLSLEDNYKAYPEQSKSKTMFKYYAQNVWVRAGLAAFYIYLFREIKIYMNPQLAANKKEDEE